MLINLCTDSVLFYTCLYKGEKQIRKEICHFFSFLLSRLWLGDGDGGSGTTKRTTRNDTSNSLSICLSSYDAIKLSSVLFRTNKYTFTKTVHTCLRSCILKYRSACFYLKITDFDELEARERKEKPWMVWRALCYFLTPQWN